ncbi:hypothetical protein FRC01_006872 [Tulasnella sp. 417]|nr:hypothetical protein FRC01_006872 [Tulasnella sp. 417]
MLPDDVENAILTEFQQRAASRKQPSEAPEKAAGPVTAPANETLPIPANPQPLPLHPPTEPAPRTSTLQGLGACTDLDASMDAVAGGDRGHAGSRPKRLTVTTKPLHAAVRSDEDEGAQPSSGDDSDDQYVPSPPKSPREPRLASVEPQTSSGLCNARLTHAAVPALPSTAPAQELSAGVPSSSSQRPAAQGESIYRDVGIRSPEQHRKHSETKIDKKTWDLLLDDSIPYNDSESEPEKWPAALKKYHPADWATDREEVYLPPLLDEATDLLQWGEKHQEIVEAEKAQFLALPPRIRKCAGRVNSNRNKVDIYMRRFWAPYVMINVCIIDHKDSLVKANAELVEYTFRRFQHLSPDSNTTETALTTWKEPLRQSINTFSSRIRKEFEKLHVEPKVNQVQMQQALSFVAGELRRGSAPNIWASEEGQNQVNKLVADRMAAFAEEKGLPVTDPHVQAQRLSICSAASAVLFREQSEETQRKFREKAQDPSMPNADFTDASAPMARSFLDAVTEETDALALLAYAVKTSQGPLLIVSQHGEPLKQNSFLQSKGTDFLKPFIDAASAIFDINVGQLGFVTAEPAVPAEVTDYPWTKKKRSQVQAPNFSTPVTTANAPHNAKLLKQSILESIRSYTGESPPFATVIAQLDKYIIPATQPTWLVDPSAMPVAMLEVWVDHWLKSVDPDSDLPPEKRLRFTGQASYEELLPLRDLSQEDSAAVDDETYQPPWQSKPAPKKVRSTTVSKSKGKAKEAPKTQTSKARSLSKAQVYVEVPTIKRGPPSRCLRLEAEESPKSGAQDGGAVSEEETADVPSVPTAVPPIPTSVVPPALSPGGAPSSNPRPTPISPPPPIPMDFDSSLAPAASQETQPAPRPSPPPPPPAAKELKALVSYSSDHESPRKSTVPALGSDHDSDVAMELSGSNLEGEDDSARPNEEEEPLRPKKHPRPRPITSETRVARQAQVSFKVAVPYNFKVARTDTEIAGLQIVLQYKDEAKGFAQTIHAQVGWWYKFSDGLPSKPKSLSFISKANLFAGRLSEWGVGLNMEDWLRLTGIDRAVILIMLSAALWQLHRQPELDERKNWETTASLLLHLQVLVTHCKQDGNESDGGPVSLREEVPSPVQWPEDHPWAATANHVAVEFSQDETDDKLPDTTAAVDHYAAQNLLSDYQRGLVKLLSPQKKRTPHHPASRRSPPPSPSPAGPPAGPSHPTSGHQPSLFAVPVAPKPVAKPTPQSVSFDLEEQLVPQETAPGAEPVAETELSQAPALAPPPSSPLSEPPPLDYMETDSEDDAVGTKRIELARTCKLVSK